MTKQAEIILLLEKHDTFKSAVQANVSSINDVDDWIDYWHTSGEISEKKSLREFLGMSKQEYAEWMRNPAAINVFIDNQPKKGS